MFDYLLKKYLFLFDEFNKIGEVFKPTLNQLPVGKLYYLDFDYGKERPVTPKSS